MEKNNNTTDNNPTKVPTTPTSSKKPNGEVETASSWTSEQLIEDALARSPSKDITPTPTKRKAPSADSMARTKATSTDVENKKIKTDENGKIICTICIVVASIL